MEISNEIHIGLVLRSFQVIGAIGASPLGRKFLVTLMKSWEKSPRGFHSQVPLYRWMAYTDKSYIWGFP